MKVDKMKQSKSIIVVIIYNNKTVIHVFPCICDMIVTPQRYLEKPESVILVPQIIYHRAFRSAALFTNTGKKKSGGGGDVLLLV